jgi:hypothetical protein
MRVWTATYDDGAHTVLNKTSGCTPSWQSTTTYNADGNWISALSYLDGTATMETTTYSGFEEICVD